MNCGHSSRLFWGVLLISGLCFSFKLPAQKINLHKAKVSLTTGQMAKGLFYEATDSAVVLVMNPAISQKHPQPDTWDLDTIAIDRVEKIRIRNVGVTEMGTMIGAIGGGAAGMVIMGSEVVEWRNFSEEDNDALIFGGIVGAVVGGVVVGLPSAALSTRSIKIYGSQARFETHKSTLNRKGIKYELRKFILD